MQITEIYYNARSITINLLCTVIRFSLYRLFIGHTSTEHVQVILWIFPLVLPTLTKAILPFITLWKFFMGF